MFIRIHPQTSHKCLFWLVCLRCNCRRDGGSGCSREPAAAWSGGLGISGSLLEAPMAHDGLHTWGPHWHSLELTASVHPQTQRRTKAELATTSRLISCSRTMMATRSRGWPSRLRPARVANLVPLGQGIGHLPSRTR